MLPGAIEEETLAKQSVHALFWIIEQNLCGRIVSPLGMKELKRQDLRKSID